MFLSKALLSQGGLTGLEEKSVWSIRRFCSSRSIYYLTIPQVFPSFARPRVYERKLSIQDGTNLQAVSEGETERLLSAEDRASSNGSKSPSYSAEEGAHSAVSTNGIKHSNNGAKVQAPDVVGSNGVHFPSGSYQPTSPEEIANRYCTTYTGSKQH